jgi:sec-independent protein translocase protein TatA
MPNLGGGELIIILVIVLILFGVGRISRIGGELGQAVGNFRKGLKDGNDDDKAKNDDLNEEGQQQVANQRLSQ